MEEKTQEKTYPLVLVFYLDREMMKNKEIMQPFASSINNMIAQKNYNTMAFFIPTDGEERVECINPLTAPKEEMEKIDKLINDITVSFSIGEKFENIPDEDVELDEE